MHIAIDDTYGPEAQTGSRYVSGRRRTHVATVFRDCEVSHIREQIKQCLDHIVETTGVRAAEFHFVDLYNRKPPWAGLPEGMNLEIFEFFASIYSAYRWPVMVQTIDDRTFVDHGMPPMAGTVGGFDLSDRSDQSLLLLLCRIKWKYKSPPTDLTLLVDEGRRRPGAPLADALFRGWPASYRGLYASSLAEPLLQIADFLAFCINRSTHLQMKTRRTSIDTWFLKLIERMDILSDDLNRVSLPSDFSVADIDAMHLIDRRTKNLE
jgi:hypothetical protein